MRRRTKSRRDEASINNHGRNSASLCSMLAVTKQQINAAENASRISKRRRKEGNSRERAPRRGKASLLCLCLPRRLIRNCSTRKRATRSTCGQITNWRLEKATLLRTIRMHARSVRAIASRFGNTHRAG